MSYRRTVHHPDSNEAAIIDALERIGADVMAIRSGRKGCPDLVVGYRGVNWLLEVKNPDGRDEVSPEQQAFLKSWPGPTAVVRSAEEAIAVVTGQRKGEAAGCPLDRAGWRRGHTRQGGRCDVAGWGSGWLESKRRP